MIPVISILLSLSPHHAYTSYQLDHHIFFFSTLQLAQIYKLVIQIHTVPSQACFISSRGLVEPRTGWRCAGMQEGRRTGRKGEASGGERETDDDAGKGRDLVTGRECMHERSKVLFLSLSFFFSVDYFFFSLVWGQLSMESMRYWACGSFFFYVRRFVWCAFFLSVSLLPS